MSQATRGAASQAIASATIDLLLRPGTFFSTRKPVIRGWGVPAIVVVLGLDNAAKAYRSLPHVTAGYGSMWGTVALMLAVVLVMIAPLRWFIGRAWFRARIRLAGAAVVNSDHAAAIFGFSELILAVTMLAWTTLDLGLSPVRPLFSPTVMLATAWSQFAAYQGVRAAFPVSPWKARVWFLVVPGLFYVWGYWRFL